LAVSAVDQAQPAGAAQFEGHPGRMALRILGSLFRLGDPSVSPWQRVDTQRSCPPMARTLRCWWFDPAQSRAWGKCNYASTVWVATRPFAVKHQANQHPPDPIAEKHMILNNGTLVAAYLNQQELKKACEHILVIADPRTLGEMRKHYQPALSAKLVGEIGKDFVKHSVESLKGAISMAG
jgi:protein required for attachment to host cells